MTHISGSLAGKRGGRVLRTGQAGQGGAAGPKLIDPPAWEAFILQLRTPRQQMPPYTTRVLSDQQAADIYAHIKTFPLPADPATIPMLRN